MPFVLDLTLTYAIIYLGRDNVLLSMILCFHQRKLQVESCKCSGSFFGQSIYNFSALSALTSKEGGQKRACKMWKIDGWIYSEFSSLMQYWSRSQTWDTWRLEPRWEGGGDTVMWWPDNDNTMPCVMCHPHTLWRHRKLYSEGRRDHNCWLRHEHKESHLSLSQLRRLTQTLWLSYLLYTVGAEF